MNEALRISESPNSRQARCAYCHDSVSLENEHRCSGCEVLLHQDCCSQLNECPTLGCSFPLPQISQNQTGEQLGTVIGVSHAHAQQAQVDNFSHFMVGAKALAKLAYQNLPVIYLSTALICMFLGMGLGHAIYHYYDLSFFKDATITPAQGQEHYYSIINGVIHVSQSYLDYLHSDRITFGGFMGFFIGLALRFLYLAVAAFGRRVNDVEEIKEKIKKNNSKSA